MCVIVGKSVAQQAAPELDSGDRGHISSDDVIPTLPTHTVIVRMTGSLAPTTYPSRGEKRER